MTKLKALRLQRGLSQGQLAEEIKIHRTLISRIEGGWYAKPPHPELVGKLKGIFGHQWDWQAFMEDTPEPRPEAE